MLVLISVRLVLMLSVDGGSEAQKKTQRKDKHTNSPESKEKEFRLVQLEAGNHECLDSGHFHINLS